MDNAFDEMSRAVQQARDIDRAVDSQLNSMADLLRGRLRKVGPDYLAELKRELRDFNMQTRRWKAK